ncbi:hypothetical protein [Chryseobacterium defluvii]|uniref:Uncharacterized protein n=1 Tax=Chryseobacterium defluvii TaxID=160396 RepID=A0A495SF45_9FLAO|nr:hypothetical protein [Chryseobacterium defluvii]RKS98239.1 hypothetical protein BCF58_2380 [Chryseobacterium defluvii]
MNELMTTLNKSVYKNATGTVDITVMHLVALGVGAVGLYFMVPERKRRNLFK